MKTIKNIDDKPVFFEELTEELKSKLLSYRQELKLLISNVAAKNSNDSLDLYQAGLKLMLDGPDYSLEDAQFRVLFDQVKENPLKRPIPIHAGLVQKFTDAEK